MVKARLIVIAFYVTLLSVMAFQIAKFALTAMKTHNPAQVSHTPR